MSEQATVIMASATRAEVFNITTAAGEVLGPFSVVSQWNGFMDLELIRDPKMRAIVARVGKDETILENLFGGLYRGEPIQLCVLRGSPELIERMSRPPTVMSAPPDRPAERTGLI